MTPSGRPAEGALWYKTILQDVTCPNDGTGLYNDKPEGFDGGFDNLNWAIVVPSSSADLSLQSISNGQVIDTQNPVQSLNFGSSGPVSAGFQRL
jgi:hypothetical protein